MKLFLLLGLLVACANSEVIRLLISGYGTELDTIDFDTETFSLNRVARQTWGEAMTFMELRGDNLYAIHEVDNYEEITNDGAVSRWTLGDDGLTWERQEYFGTKGVGPAHVGTNPDGTLLSVANYGGGSASFFDLDESGAIIGQPFQSITYTYFTEEGGVPSRQDAPHPHQVIFTDDNLYIADLGGDRIYQLSIDEENTVANAEIYDIEAGSGPRHMAIDAARSRFYLLNELKATINIYELESDGKLSLLNIFEFEIDDVSSDPLAQTNAEIQVLPDGSGIYVSSRGVGSLLLFNVVEEFPYLVKKLDVKVTGTWPRHFITTDDGTFIFVTSKWENLLDVYQVGDLGDITFVAAVQTVPLPTITQIVN